MKTENEKNQNLLDKKRKESFVKDATIESLEIEIETKDRSIISQAKDLETYQALINHVHKCERYCFDKSKEDQDIQVLKA